MTDRIIKVELPKEVCELLEAFQKAAQLDPAGGWRCVTPAHIREEISGLRRRVAALELENKKLRARTPNRKGVKVKPAQGRVTAADHAALNRAVRRERQP